MGNIMVELKPKALIVGAGLHFVKDSKNTSIKDWGRYRKGLRKRLHDLVAISRMVILHSDYIRMR